MKKALHMSIISVILVAIIFTALMLVLKYDEKGETNMPFEVSKISIISTVDAQNVEDNTNKWNKNVELNNDIYIYLDKNKDYKKTETIEKIIVDNIKIIQEPQKGEISVYKPSESKATIFENKEENKITQIEFTGEQATDIQKLQISNQGGIIAFRFANQNIGNLVSNDNELEYKDLLKKINMTDEELNAKISFDIDIVLGKGKQFKATDVELEIPAGNTVEEGKSSKEMTDLKLVFKRIEN